jgi:hypothetical protein
VLLENDIPFEYSALGQGTEGEWEERRKRPREFLRDPL